MNQVCGLKRFIARLTKLLRFLDVNSIFYLIKDKLSFENVRTHSFEESYNNAKND